MSQGLTEYSSFLLGGQKSITEILDDLGQSIGSFSRLDCRPKLYNAYNNAWRNGDIGSCLGPPRDRRGAQVRYWFLLND